MIERPFAVVVTGLEHGAEFPAAIPPVERSSCFHTIELVAGLNATSRLIVSAFAGADVRHWMICVELLITGCCSDGGGDSSAVLPTLAQTTSTPLTGSQEPIGHCTPLVRPVTYCASV